MVTPLAGLRVLDLTRFVAGSYVTMALGALGAEIVKLEPPPGGDPYRRQGTAFIDGESVLFLCLNSGKRSLALDFRKPEAAAVVRRLVEAADIVVQNARPGALTPYGLDWPQVHAVNPRAVYASISGYGEVGPAASRGGFDMVLQAEGGLMGVTGVPDGPPVAIGAPLLDIGAGTACLAAILAALLDRASTGVGIDVSSSLLEFSVAGLSTLAASHLASGDVPGPNGSHSPMFAPYGAFRARDGYVVLAGAGSEHLWHRLCELIGRPELRDDPRFADNAARVAHRDALVAEIEAALAARDAAEWVSVLDGAGIPAGQVARLDALLASPQVDALGLLHELEHPEAGPYATAAFPIRLGGHALAPRHGAPRLGDDTYAVLEELGLDADEIAALAAAGAIAP